MNKNLFILSSILIVVSIIILIRTANAEDINFETLDLLWSAETYTPLNYEGKALPVKGASVVVATDLEVSGINPINLKYSWFLDDVFQENKSGYGKNTFKFGIRRNAGMTHLVLVKIFNENRSFLVEKSITIPIVNPEIIVYDQKDGDQGNGSFLVPTDQKISFVAKPYFFSAKKLTDITFEWIFSGQEPITSSDYRASILDLTISGKADRAVENDLRVSAFCNEDPRQKASQSIKVKIY